MTPPPDLAHMRAQAASALSLVPGFDMIAVDRAALLAVLDLVDTLRAELDKGAEQFRRDVLEMLRATAEIDRLKPYEEAAHNVADIVLAEKARAERAEAALNRIHDTSQIDQAHIIARAALAPAGTQGGGR